MRDLAQRLIDHETTRLGTAGATTPASFPVCAKLRPHLATLMGSTGFRVLLSRALQLSRETVSWLRFVMVNPEGTVEMIVGTQPPEDLQVMENGSVELVARLLALLAAFIGEALTLRIVQDAWPKLPPAGRASDKGLST